MHWSSNIGHGTAPSSVPPMDEVNIEWVHATLEMSLMAARNMFNANAKLKEVGRSYGVIKFVGGATDKPHWSTDGH
ncbi:hypothetical protein LMG19087_03349 [Ralstonia wenshanensis]|nr:hypothetical protein LMG19087_03349 [Ralstonia wenshanensis]